MTLAYTPDEIRAQARRMVDIPRGEATSSVFFNLGAGAAMLEVSADQIQNLQDALAILQTKFALQENAYNAALELQTVLLDRILQRRVDG